MPNGLKCFYGNGDLHFVTASCYHRDPLLGTPRGRDLFLRVLEQVRQRCEFVVVGYVVMPELGSLDFARDFGSGLRRPLVASTYLSASRRRPTLRW